MSITALPQLEEIASALAVQEEDLTAQLKAVQAKLSGIRTVLSMFEGEATTAAAAPTISKTAAAASEEAVAVEAETHVSALPKKTATAATKKSATKKTTAKKAATKKTTAKKTATKKTATKAKSSKATAAKKSDGRTADWQKYARPGVKNQSIPDAVKLVLATQPEKDFSTAEVMEALFKENMPKALYLKARHRVSNVLSGDARAGDWHRGERSSYRMNAA